MSIWSYLWPWSQKRRDRVEKQKEIERQFQQQLETAVVRQKSLKDATDRIREDREKRQTKVRVPYHSQPLLQD